SRLIVEGTLNADGTAVSPIVFTSLKDDGYGGDTNGDADASSPAAQDWVGIGFDTTSVGNVLDHVVVRYAGASSNFSRTASVYTA
mgnify:CR=1